MIELYPIFNVIMNKYKHISIRRVSLCSSSRRSPLMNTPDGTMDNPPTAHCTSKECQAWFNQSAIPLHYVHQTNNFAMPLHIVFNTTCLKTLIWELFEPWWILKITQRSITMYEAIAMMLVKYEAISLSKGMHIRNYGLISTLWESNRVSDIGKASNRHTDCVFRLLRGDDAYTTADADADATRNRKKKKFCHGHEE